MGTPLAGKTLIWKELPAEKSPEGKKHEPLMSKEKQKQDLVPRGLGQVPDVPYPHPCIPPQLRTETHVLTSRVIITVTLSTTYSA